MRQLHESSTRKIVDFLIQSTSPVTSKLHISAHINADKAHDVFYVSFPKQFVEDSFNRGPVCGASIDFEEDCSGV